MGKRLAAMALAGLLATTVAASGAQAGSAAEVRDYAADPPRSYAGEVRDLVGLTTESGAVPKGVVSTVSDLEQAVKDLEAEVDDRQIRVDLSADVLFDFDRWNIKPAAEQALRKVALIIREKGRGEILIHGHTDAKGSADYNQRLSERRAESVMYWLAVNEDIAMDLMKIRGFGETRPVAPNTRPDGSDDPAGRARNRRVEIVIETVQRNP